MRTIKFRGFNRKNKEWLYGFYLQNRGAHFVCPDEFATGKSWDDYEVEPETVGQFTGLTDKNGREIYEGDVVDDSWCFADTGIVCFGEYQHLNAQIGYENGDVGFYIKHLGETASVIRPDILFFAANCEVIGNIHDNPELYKTK